MIDRGRRAGLSWVGLLALQACGAGWHRTDIVTPESPRQQVEVWQGNSSQQWHAVRVTDSTVSGISYLRAIDCDSCRQSVPRSAVDSIRLGNPVRGFLGTLALVVILPALVIGWIFRDLGRD